MSWIDDIKNLIPDAISDALYENFVQPLGWAAEWAFDAGNDQFSKYANSAVTLLKMSPSEWNADGWNTISAINTSFVALGATLVIIFWCIKLCSDNLDIRQTMRPETMIKELTVLIVGEWFVCSAFDLFSSLFGLVSYLTNGVTSTSIDVTIPSNVSTYLNAVEDLGAGWLSIFTGLIYMILMTFCGMQILYHAYVRFFKVMIIAPYASLVTSTVAGPNSINHSTIAFFKYALSTILEAVTMIIVIKLAATFFSSGLVGFETSSSTSISEFSQLWGWAVKEVILAFVMVGGIKESAVITQRALGS